MRVIRWRIGALVLFLIVIAFVVVELRQRAEPDRSLERVQKAGVLIVGLDPSYAPFEVVNGQGNLEGFDVDLTRAIAERLGVKASLVSIDYGGIFDALEVGKFDAIIGGVTSTPDQSKIFSFTRPYYDAGLVVLRGTSDSGQVLGYESGSDADVNLVELRTELAGFELRPFDDQDRIHSALQQKSLGGAVVDAVTASSWARDVPGLSILPHRLTSVPLTFAIRNRDQALFRALDRVLQTLLDDGQVAALERKWLS
jgi:polar amino acid transport system substrate-binding protein